MSSFNIYDNYNSFNDLINRTELLEEKTYKAMVKGANLGPELKKFRTEDGKGLSATSRIKNLILISALVQMDLLDDDVAKTLRKKATSSTYITNTLKDLAPKVHAELFDGDKPGSEEVVKYVQDNIEQLVPFAVKNVTRGEFERAEVDTEEPDNDEAKELEDEVSAEVRLAKGLIDQEADKVELDFDDVDVNIEALDNKDEVAAKIVQLINTTNNLKAEPTGVGLNIEGPVGVFGSEEKVSDQITRLITKYFPAVSEGQIKVTLNTDKEEDYEEGPEPMEPEGPANEYEEDINEVEDEDNEFDDFDIGPQSDENVPDDYEEVLAALVDDDKKKHALKQLNGEDEEEAIVMKPMLESHKTDTSAYLTEQSASDKRNKKTEVKNQSFKEKYKPKTHWQLEELRRYGL